MNKKYIIYTIVFIIVLSVTIFPKTYVFSENTSILSENNGTLSENSSNIDIKIEENPVLNGNETIKVGDIDVGIPVVTMDEISTKITDKMMEIVKAIQKIALPLCAIFFIAAAISGITGVGNKNGFYGSVKGMIFSGLAFVGILQAEKIVLFFYTWLVK